MVPESIVRKSTEVTCIRMSASIVATTQRLLMDTQEDLSICTGVVVSQAGKVLRGAAKERMEALGQRLAVEQQQYMEEQWRNGTADHKRYSFVTHEAQLHMQADVERQRQRIIAYPRLYRFYASMPIRREAGNKNGMAIFPAGTLLSQPSEREFVCPPVPQKLSLEKFRIPAPAVAAVPVIAAVSILPDLPADMIGTVPPEAAGAAANTVSDGVGPNPDSPVAAEEAPIELLKAFTGNSAASASLAEGIGQTLPQPSTMVRTPTDTYASVQTNRFCLHV